MELMCPKCGHLEATITLNMNDGQTMNCSECGDDFDEGDVRAKLKAINDNWNKMLAWAGKCPARDAG